MYYNSLFKLKKYIEKENYRGYDPYDGLTSPLFKLPFLRANKLLRFLFQQFVKRCPINIRPILFIPKGYNPVTLGLCIQSYSRLCVVFPENRGEYLKKIDFLISELEKLIPEGYSGACWGYDFDWAARYSNIPAYQPTVVATGIITNALFLSYQMSGNQRALKLCISASEFILKDLNRTYELDNFCFSYSPFDKQVVFNASMKGARLLAQVYSVTHNIVLKQEATKAVSFVMKYQENSGAWVYAVSKVGTWIDNYHTGYIIDCLDDYIKYTEDYSFEINLRRGYQFYLDNFFKENKIPQFYDKKVFPIDCTAAGQSLLTLTRFNNVKLAENIACWMTKNMQHRTGYFYFRKLKYYTIKQSFMRWSNAWMLAGLSELLYVSKK